MITTKLKIRFCGDSCLRKRSSLVKEVGPSERLLISSMIKAMHENQGIGLAAPQVGVGERILVADIGKGPIAMINPRIVKRQGSSVMEEGCLSIPGVSINIKRSKRIVVKYLNKNNCKVEREFDDLMATVIQHEIDHLNGKLIVDYARLRERLKFKKQLKQLRQLSKGSLEQSPKGSVYADHRDSPLLV